MNRAVDTTRAGRTTFGTPGQTRPAVRQHPRNCTRIFASTGTWSCSWPIPPCLISRAFCVHHQPIIAILRTPSTPFSQKNIAPPPLVPRLAVPWGCPIPSNSLDSPSSPTRRIRSVHPPPLRFLLCCRTRLALAANLSNSLDCPAPHPAPRAPPARLTGPSARPVRSRTVASPHFCQQNPHLPRPVPPQFAPKTAHV